MIEAWGNNASRDLISETKRGNLTRMNKDDLQDVFFACLWEGNLVGVQNVTNFDTNLAHSKMYGYEGADLHSNVEGARRYHHTGYTKDGFFYPLHVAASSPVGRECVVYLVRQCNAFEENKDYRENTAEEKSNTETRKAFFELRGLIYEAKERYVGATAYGDKNIRSGTGVLYYKPEGYESLERVLYRGMLKENLYHGQGALYWPGSDILQYKGRFKAGVKVGRGVLYDSKGNKIYHGTFRNGMKDGRGELFEEVEGTFTRTYHGEFAEDKMHGFGVAYYGAGGTFVGRFEYGIKAGVGVYAYPNGDRFEGMFFNDKPDGKGSYYNMGPDNKELGTHYIWQNGRKVTQLETPFVPDQLDMPDDDVSDINSNAILAKIMSSDNALDDDASVNSGQRRNNDDDDDDDDDRGVSRNRSGGKRSSVWKKGRGGYEKDNIKPVKAFGDEHAHGDWKKMLGKAVRIIGKTAVTMGMEQPLSEEQEMKKAHAVERAKHDRQLGVDGAVPEGDEDDEGVEPDEEDEEVDMDDVISSHFLSFAPLLTAYVYVTSASKVFEGRSAIAGIMTANDQQNGKTSDQQPDITMNVPEFDAVNHLVMDAIEDYNERWEKAFATQKAEDDARAEEQKKKEDEKDMNEAQSVDGPSSHRNSVRDDIESAGIVSKMMNNNVFMTEAEKRKELKRTQRAKLAAKKGGGTLSAIAEGEIGILVYNLLEKELISIAGEAAGDELAGMDGLTPTRAWQTRSSSRRKDWGRSSDNDDDSIGTMVDEQGNEFATELLYLLRMAKSVL